MSKKERFQQISVEDLLRVDPFSQVIQVSDDNENNEYIDKAFFLVRDNKEFFDNLYCGFSENGVINIIDGGEIKSVTVNVENWIKSLKNSQNSQVVFIEGYAGCGKTVFVQYLLKTLLATYNYEFSYYNYDIGAHYNEDNTNRIKYSLIECFISNIERDIKIGKGDYLEEFQRLFACEEIVYLDSTKKIYYEFANLQSYKDTIFAFSEDKDNEMARNDFRTSIRILVEKFSLEQIMYLDFLYRLAKYFVKGDKNGLTNLYICFDNMDSIDDLDELNLFDKSLISVRHNIDEFLLRIENSHSSLATPHFIFLAAYRKITASKVDLSRLSERRDDYPEDNEFILHIDVSHVYQFRDIIKSRRTFFSRFLPSYKNEKSRELVASLQLADALSEIDFLRNRYAGLWNNNYRTCSSILRFIIEDFREDVEKCIELRAKDNDGYDAKKYIYFGASSFLLNLICKAFNNGGLWGSNHMNLIPLGVNNVNKNVSQLTSLSRLILTYMYNAKSSDSTCQAVSTRELFENLSCVYSSDEICSCLSQMLARDRSDTWRRPIYYFKNAISSNIYANLNSQYEDYQNKRNSMKFSELQICECGTTYIEQIVSEFEFFSNRINPSNSSLYIVHEKEKLERIISDVYSAVKCCCVDIERFNKSYIELMNIDTETFLQSKLHPRTRIYHNPQLHTERVIFAHIAYLNYCRMFHLEYDKTKNENEINTIFVEYIRDYLELYRKFIHPMFKNRETIAKTLSEKVERVLSATNEKEAYLSIEV